MMEAMAVAMTVLYFAIAVCTLLVVAYALGNVVGWCLHRFMCDECARAREANRGARVISIDDGRGIDFRNNRWV